MSRDAAARYAVVGCLTRDCRELWVRNTQQGAETATCPRCGSTHAVNRLRPQARADEADVACELRARILAQRADAYEQYADTDDYAILSERADEYLERSEALFEATVNTALDRQTRARQELFASAADRYLSQDEPLAAEADAYLERRQNELDALVDASLPPTDKDDSSSITPFSDRPADEQPSAAGLTLTTPETLPDQLDVRLADPPIAPTDLWTTLWQPEPLHDRLRDALDTLTGQSYQSVWVTLVEDGGVTALAATDDPTYAEYVLDTLKHPTPDRWFDLVRVTRQLGGGTVLGNSELADIINGPVALFASVDETPRIAIHLSHDFFDYKRIQRVRFLDFLVSLSHGFDVRLVCHGSLAPKKLLRLHEADLPTVAVTEAPQTYRDAASRAAGSPGDVADAAFADMGLDHQDTEVLDVLADAPNERREYGELKADTAFSVSPQAVGARVRRLIERGLVSKDRFNTTNYIQLLPAGAQFLARRDQEREAQDVQTVLDGFSDAKSGDTTAETVDSGDPIDPPNHSHGTVYARASTGGGDREASPSTVAGADDADQADATAATVETVDDVPAEIVASGEWLSIDQQTAVSSAIETDDGGLDIALADEPVPTKDHAGDYRVGFNGETNEVIVSLQPSPCAARTVTRLCAALLDPRLRHSLLTADVLDGEDDEGLGALLESTLETHVLRNARNFGWLPDRAASGEAYREQLLSALTDLLEDVEEVGDGDEFDPDLARSVCQRGHGLAGVVTHIYDLLGWTVVRELTFPEYSRHFHSSRYTYLETLAVQIAVTSRYGHYPMYRILFEDDEEKRANSLGAPSVDVTDPVGECLGAWVLRGPGINRLARDLTDLAAAADLALQEDGENFAAFFAELRIGQATRLASVREATNRLCRIKHLEATRPATALLYALTGSVYQTATALSGLAAGDEGLPRPIQLDEVRFALATLDPDALLPNLDSDEDGTRRKSTRSKMMHAQLTASSRLSTREWAEAAGVSTESIRTHRDDLAALGLLEIDDRGPGKATYYRLRLPFRDERGEADAPRPAQLVARDGESQHQSIRDVVCDLLEARGLLDEAYADRAISDGLVGWPPTLEPAVERWPWLRPWIDVIARLLGVEGGGSLRGPGRWIDGPYELSSRFGAELATQQTTVATAAVAGD